MLSKIDGYSKAAQVDKLLMGTANLHPIEVEENYAGYLALIRTVRTTLDMMEKINGKHSPKCSKCGK